MNHAMVAMWLRLTQMESYSVTPTDSSGSCGQKTGNSSQVKYHQCIHNDKLYELH